MDFITHDEDIWFDFRGDSADQLTSGRYYQGVVDGFADFGVFINLASGVTGLLHRSELDRRLESLDWETGDEVFVQVQNVRSNGNIDLGWSIRQSPEEFRGSQIHDPSGEVDGEEPSVETESTAPIKRTPQDPSAKTVGADETSGSESESESGGGATGTVQTAAIDAESTEESSNSVSEPSEPSIEPTEVTRTHIETLSEHVGERVSIEAEIESIRQTGGPTIFQVQDESGHVECAAFVEAGVRAYSEVNEGDYISITGEIERRQGDIQIEVEELTQLDGSAAAAVETRLSDALSEEARPEEIDRIHPDSPVSISDTRIADAAEIIRSAVLESRPVVIRHPATADGYVAGAGLERAIIEMIRDEHDRADAEYHFLKRRPLDDPVYGMDAATNDITRMLQDTERHDEKVPVIVLAGIGGTSDSLDGLELLNIYDAMTVLLEADTIDSEVRGATDALVAPEPGEDTTAVSTAALAVTLAININTRISDEIEHLPAVSYWGDTPAVYESLASSTGYDASRTQQLREAIELEAYYQSYQDKRELITDLLFNDDGGLAEHVSEQFRIKLTEEVNTATASLNTQTMANVTVNTLDANAYTHRFDFPPTPLLAEAVHREIRNEQTITVVYSTDELFIHGSPSIDVRSVATSADKEVPEAGITAVGVRQNRIEFLSGAQDEAVDAVISAAVNEL
jgi:RecJ-like exonuclease